MLTWSQVFYVDLVTGFLCCLGHMISMLTWTHDFYVDLVTGFLC